MVILSAVDTHIVDAENTTLSKQSIIIIDKTY